MEPEKQEVLTDVNKPQPKKKKTGGRKRMYGEPTTVYSVNVPKSKKSKVKKMVDGYLMQFRK